MEGECSIYSYGAVSFGQWLIPSVLRIFSENQVDIATVDAEAPYIAKPSAAVV